MSHSQQKGPSRGKTNFFCLYPSSQFLVLLTEEEGWIILFVCWSVYQSLGLSLCMSVGLAVYWSVCLSVCLSVCQSSFKNKGVNISLVFEKVVVVYLTLYFYPGVIQSTPLLVEKFWLKFRRHQNVWQLSWRQNTPIVRYAEQIMCRPL